MNRGHRRRAPIVLPLPSRRVVVPLYLALCLLLGGASAAGYAANFVLQIVALPLLIWAAMAWTDRRLNPPIRSLLALAVALLALFAVQLVPLPPAVWSLLPGRTAIAQGYAMLGQAPPWLPVSLAPAATLASLLWLVPAFAVLAGMVVTGGFRAKWVGWAVVAVTALSVFVGALQVVGGRDSPWYFYTITNHGQAVGFFANSNHAATLLVCAIPFLAALQFSALARRGSARQASGLVVITTAAFLVVAVGLAINLSLAGIGLAVPVSVASFMLLRASPGRRMTAATVATGVLMLVAVATILIGPFGNNLTGQLAGDPAGVDQLSRRVSIAKTLDASVDYLPLGSGIGSFRGIYQTLESPADVFTTYMNHAHSDVAEILLEAGVPGLILMLLLLAWWGARAVALWRAEKPDYFARAAVIASGAIIAHSFVDYPLRTAAISALFAACLALMAEARPYSARALAPAGGRHFEVD